jgi:hypothetical protein
MVPVGFNKPRRAVDQPPEPRTVWPRWRGLNGKTLWDWLLLISALAVPAVPILIGSAGLYYEQQLKHRIKHGEYKQIFTLLREGRGGASFRMVS